AGAVGACALAGPLGLAVFLRARLAAGVRRTLAIALRLAGGLCAGAAGGGAVVVVDRRRHGGVRGSGLGGLCGAFAFEGLGAAWGELRHGDPRADLGLDGAEEFAFVGVAERDGDALRAGTPGAPDAVHIRL